MKQLRLMGGIAVALFFATSVQGSKLKGTVKIDGSSTVFPITEAVAEEFRSVQPRVRITVGVSGTGGGFKKFTAGETDINDASRTIKQKEIELAAKNGIQYLEVPVASDGITVAINKNNTWVDHLTVDELKRIWSPGSKVKSWRDVRPSWPDKPISLYGPGTDSGTFDYFTEAINGKSHSARSDFTKSEDDNTLVKGVAGDLGSLGFFGFAYYLENKDKIKAVAIDGGKGPVMPTMKTINNGTYTPLSRPVFIYVSHQSAKRPEVNEFINFYLDQAPMLVKEVGYVPLQSSVYSESKAEFARIAKK